MTALQVYEEQNTEQDLSVALTRTVRGMGNGTKLVHLHDSLRL